MEVFRADSIFQERKMDYWFVAKQNLFRVFEYKSLRLENSEPDFHFRNNQFLRYDLYEDVKPKLLLSVEVQYCFFAKFHK